MNKYYKVYRKAFDNKVTEFYYLPREEDIFSGKILKINSLATGDMYRRHIGEDTSWIPILCSLVTDENIIHELNKIAVFSNE